MSNYILTLPLKTKKYQEDRLNKDLDKYRKMYNSCLSELYKRYNHMIQSKEYQQNIKYKGKDRNKIFTKINKKYGLTEYSLHTYVKPMSKYYKLHSAISQKVATRCFNAFQGFMFHKSKKVYFKKYGELNSFEGKSNTTGISFKSDFILWNKINIPIIIKANDLYAQKAIQDKIKYCRILRKSIKGKTKFYVQLILEGTPPTKVTNQGEIKGRIGKGRVGIDIGTRTIAYSSKYKVGLLELAPSINNIDKEIKLLQRYMDRSKRATNANKFNKDGTINIKNKDKWKYSNRYLKAKAKRKELYRKQSEIRKHDHYKLINELLVLGNKFYVETMNYKGLQARSKETTINEKTGRYNKKKRFGKSLANKAPAMFLTMLDNKLKWNDEELYEIDTYSCKASQYNHITNEYNKKKLSERWNDFGEFKIQRDLYSAFLIMNVKNNLKEIDRELCFKEFDNFKELHDIEILRLQGLNNLSSMGI